MSVAISRPGQSRADFMTELRLRLGEHRDTKVDKLRKRYAPRLARLEEQSQTARGRV